LGHLPALELGMPLRGQRLFNLSDVQRAQEIHTLVQLGLEAASAAKKGALQERQRIAADLHDDLGAKLLTIAQTAQNPQQGGRVAELARQALEDMRLAIRGLSATPVPATELQADWRAELFARLDAAGVEAQWQANEPDASLQLSAVAQVQLTRVLRETLSNVIRHSRASHCSIQVHWGDSSLSLRIQDDGIGLPQSQALPAQRHGLGLNNIERRIHKLGGMASWHSSPGTGLSLQAEIPMRLLRADAGA
jgi:signal transduction histidine kinase